MKASVVERFNRTLKNDMWKMFTLNGNYRWIDELQQLVANNVKIAAPARFTVGDPVRVSKYKTVFDKGYTPNWTTEVFRIIKVQTTNPVTYLIEDSRGEPIAGGFYKHKLHRVANPDIYLMEKWNIYDKNIQYYMNITNWDGRWRMVRWKVENSALERKEEIGEIRCKRKKEMREGKEKGRKG
ncbi:hypothetical protein DMN91_008618 [Ooceraea biroi]|uniref:Integrase catalytic domain-containing protein n=1 Tax=Ooceraea biroi TaxID=2015173 RepID=A0A3L8DDL6_OOCBI|nr:hypothetical protein DMN91_008618 [Ooceraea biroi]